MRRRSTRLPNGGPFQADILVSTRIMSRSDVRSGPQPQLTLSHVPVAPGVNMHASTVAHAFKQATGMQTPSVKP